MNKTTLSNIPSEAINQLLLDIEMIEKSPKFHINMGTYGDYRNGTCHVCLGAAHVVAQIGEEKAIANMRRGISPIHTFFVSRELRYAAYAGDSLRGGNIRRFLSYIGADSRFRTFVDWWLPPEWVKYQHSPTTFKKQLIFLAETFEELETMLEVE